MNKYLILAILLLSIALTAAVEEYRHAIKQRNFFQDQKTTNVIEGTHREINHSIDSFNIPIPQRRIISDEHTESITNNYFHPIYHDTIYIDKSTHDTIRDEFISWHNKYSFLTGTIKEGLNYKHIDTLDIVEFHKHDKWLIGKWKIIATHRKDTIQIFNKDTCSHYHIREYTKQ